MQNIWIALAIAVAALAGLWLWQLQPPSPQDAQELSPGQSIQPSSENPSITGIEFPPQLNADGEYVKGIVHFNAVGGDVVHAQFDVVAASFFVPFGFDLHMEGVTQGEFEFYVSTVIPQQVTLKVTLTDAQGHTSEPKEFSFAAVQTQDTAPGQGN